MNTSECYYILVIAIYVHENGTASIHKHSSLFSISFASYTFQTMADYDCQQIAADATEKHEHLYHLEHYARRFNFPYRNSGHTLGCHFGEKTFLVTAPILMTETSLKSSEFQWSFHYRYSQGLGFNWVSYRCTLYFVHFTYANMPRHTT